MTDATHAEPPVDCDLCPRLEDYRNHNKAILPDYHNAPAPTFGSLRARLLIVGLAPGLHGANRTGRVFTGDQSGDLLFATLHKFGLATKAAATGIDDGMRLKKTAITNAVRCAPPQNKPKAAEITACRPFLEHQVKQMKQLRAILCLGRIAHDATLTALKIPPKTAPFGHGARHVVPETKIILFDSYHCSRYNINTRRLTAKMFEKVVGDVESCIQ